MSKPLTQAAIASRFSAAADGYTAAVNVQRLVARRLEEMLAPLPAPDRILEIGCGTGLFTRRLLARFPLARIQAIDISGKMIKQAQKEVSANGRVAWTVADARTFRTSQPFPLITSSSSLHWISPLEGILENTAGLITPNGRFVFAMMLDGSLRELREARLHVAPDKHPKGRLPQKAEVVQGLSAAGFSVESIEEQKVCMTYPSAAALLKTIHDQGVTGGDVSAGELPLSATELSKLVEYYDAGYGVPEGGVTSSCVILYVSAYRRQ